MKKIFSLLSLVAIFGIYSCVDLDEIQPTDSVSPDRAITNLASAGAAIAGVYNDMQAGSGLSRSNSFDSYLSLWQYFTDECDFTGTFPTRLEFGNFSVFPDNTTSAGVFSHYYDVINVANNVIDILPTVEDASLTPETVNPILAEARMARAMMYFHLVQGYGDVPLVLEPTRAVDDKLFVATTAASAVMAQVVDDLTFAASNLTDQGVGRFSPNAANAMLARIALYQGNWQNAYNLATGVLGADFDLASFAYMADQIFSLQFSSADGNNLAFFYFASDVGGRHSIEPSAKLIDAYEDGDIRFAASIDSTTTPGIPYGIKYTDVATGSDELMFIRHAEMVLIAAEAAAQLGNFDDANMWYAQVRARAGLDATELNGDNFEDLILAERFVELAMESGHRLWDLRRTGRAMDVLGPLGYDACDNVWPLPQRDLDRNPNLQQNGCCNC